MRQNYDETLAIDRDLQTCHDAGGGMERSDSRRKQAKTKKKRHETINQSLRMALYGISMIYRFQIYEFSQLMDDNVEREISCDVTLKIIDIILLNETSLNKPTVNPLIMLIY
jgi:hypothetical protein